VLYSLMHLHPLPNCKHHYLIPILKEAGYFQLSVSVFSHMITESFEEILIIYLEQWCLAQVASDQCVWWQSGLQS